MPSGGSSTQAETIPASPAEKHTTVAETTRPIEIAPATVASSLSAPQPPGGESVQTKPELAAHPEQQAMANEPAHQIEPTAAVITPSRIAPQPPGGASVQTKPEPAAHPEQQAMANEPAHQIEPTAAGITPSRIAPQPTGGASPQAKPDSSPERQAIASVSGPQPAPAQGSGSVSRIDSPENIAFIERGMAFLKRGDLASARLLLRRAADAGSAEGALMLGSTFDPVTIQELGVIGVEPDVARARQWYQKAVELGSDAAAQRLAKLNNQ
jgi:hypothetical protein